MSAEKKYWLHVPFAMIGGNLAKSHGAQLSMLGRPATLHVMPALGEPPETPKAWVHWLMFDPMTEQDAYAVVQSLRARLPAFSVFDGAQGNVVLTLPTAEVSKVPPLEGGRAIFSGQEIAIGDAELVPQPLWAGGFGFTSYSADLLAALNSCPEVTDERLLAALELWTVASSENLPRTKFLTYMTILDSLSIQAKRDDAIVQWIDLRIAEAKGFDDPGIVGALGNLKRVSHKAALKALVMRAARQSSVDVEAMDEKIKLVGALYDARSDLSHQGNDAKFDTAKARELAAFVLRSAIILPAILDVA